MTGAVLIHEERQRQVAEEGWTAEHDDEHEFGELAGAAAAYADVAHRQVAEMWPPGVVQGRPPGQSWRWSHEWWKPSDDPIRNLVKAGALIAAEIDRLLRDQARCQSEAPVAPAPAEEVGRE